MLSAASIPSSRTPGSDQEHPCSAVGGEAVVLREPLAIDHTQNSELNDGIREAATREAAQNPAGPSNRQ
jgi:hypothetical protein